MNTTSKRWLPAGSLTPAQQWALSVPARTHAPMDQQQYLLRLEDKLQQLAQQLTPKERRAVLEVSQEYLPEIYSLAQEGLTPPELAEALMRSDSLQMLLNLIDWSRPGIERETSRETSLDEFLEHLML